MSSVQPFFSVVMPTYNRAHLLPNAVESVLRQTFGDFELVISNGGSTDNTREVVAGFDDQRIRYVESRERLSIGDNYQTGLDNAAGEYITFLSDDDVFTPVMFEKVKNIIDAQRAQMIAFQVTYYFQSDDFEYNQIITANSLEVPAFTGETTEFSPAQALNLLFSKYALGDGEQNDKFIVPFLANAVYHRDVFARVKKVRSKMFAMTPADMYLAAAVFYVIDKYICLDAPLHVWSRWEGNATASVHRHGNNLRAHYEKLLNGQPLEFTPLKFALPNNCYVNAILQAKNDFENSENKTETNWFNYYVAAYDNLVYLDDAGLNMSREFKEFDEVLSNQPAELRDRVNAVIRKPSLTAKRFLRKKLPFVSGMLKRFFQTEQTVSVPHIINGEQAGFHNVLESAQYLTDLLSETNLRSK